LQNKPFYDEDDDDDDDDDDDNDDDNNNNNNNNNNGEQQKKEEKTKKTYTLDPDHRLLLRNTKPLLQSRNASVRVGFSEIWCESFV
jgi:AP-3 complex subunit beta